MTVFMFSSVNEMNVNEVNRYNDNDDVDNNNYNDDNAVSYCPCHSSTTATQPYPSLSFPHPSLPECQRGKRSISIQKHRYTLIAFLSTHRIDALLKRIYASY